ncbi:MAG: hypothetical protein ACLQBQ_09535 [Smithella sp.]
MRRLFWKYGHIAVGIIIFILVAIIIARAGDMQPYSFPFSGKWNPTENPMLLPDYGLQDIQNLRKWGQHFKGVKGDSLIATASLGAAAINNGFQFRKGNPVESHVFAQIGTGLYKSNNTAPVPNPDTFGLFQTNVSNNLVNFSAAPDGSMVALDGYTNYVWGGKEARCASFLNFDAVSSSFLYDFTTAVNNTAINANDIATLVADSSGNTSMYIGSTRPLQGVKFYIQTPNLASGASVGVQYWNGTAWTAVSSLVDGTQFTSLRYGTCTMGQTGEISFTPTVGTAQLTVINNIALYYYKFTFTAMPSGVRVSFCTLDAPMQAIQDVWDGTDRTEAGFLHYSTRLGGSGSPYFDFTSNVLKADYDSSDTDSFVNIESVSPANGLDSTECWYLAFTGPMDGFDFQFNNTFRNTNAGATLVVQYWNGGAWVTVTSLVDGTAGMEAGLSTSMQHNGYIMWQQQSPASEFQTKVNQEGPFYWYRIYWINAAVYSAGYGAVDIDYIAGIPTQTQIHPYRFAAMWQNRLWMFNDQIQYANSVLYAAANTSNVFNGTDSGTLQFGDQTPVMAATGIYNMYFMYNGLEQLIVAKESETYRVSGTSPSTWVVQRISANVGCVAPLSMVSADVTVIDNMKKQVAIWMGDKGIYETDGASVTMISDDIRCFFDPSDIRYINPSMRSASVGWYDPSIKSYKLLIASGASATSLNMELEYSLQYQEWTKIVRMNAAMANPLQSGWQVQDTNGLVYTYGGDANGYVYQLENTNRWNGTSITSYLQTKNILPDPAAPLLRKSTIGYIQLTYLPKQTGQITIQHFGDGIPTADSVNGQAGPSNIASADALGSPYITQSVILGPNLYHSFLFQATTNIGDGLELTGFSFYYEPFTAIR